MAEGKNGAEDISVHLTGETAQRFRALREAQPPPGTTDSKLGAYLIGLGLDKLPDMRKPRARRKDG